MSITQFGWETTASDVLTGVDLGGLRAVVTGGSSGIGVETARALARAGAEVTLAVRSLDAGAEAADAIAHDVGVRPSVGHLDLSKPGSPERFAAAWSGPLHVLVNNAGIMALPSRSVNASGHEMQFATNHLGHFTLALALQPALAKGAADAVAHDILGGSRVVAVSSRGHLRAPVDFDDIDFAFRAYDGLTAYGQSKTANVLFAVEAARRWADDGIAVNAVHPGGIMETNLSRHMSAAVLTNAQTTSRQVAKTVQQGAATSVLVGASPSVTGVSGRYFEDCHESDVIGPDADDLPGHQSGVAWYAVDPAIAERLWGVSDEMTR